MRSIGRRARPGRKRGIDRTETRTWRIKRPLHANPGGKFGLCEEISRKEAGSTSGSVSRSNAARKIPTCRGVARSTITRRITVIGRCRVVAEGTEQCNTTNLGWMASVDMKKTMEAMVAAFKFAQAPWICGIGNNWTGKTLDSLMDMTLDATKSDNQGVYMILITPKDAGKPTLYIGGSAGVERLKDRVKKHRRKGTWSSKKGKSRRGGLRVIYDIMLAGGSLKVCTVAAYKIRQNEGLIWATEAVAGVLSYSWSWYNDLKGVIKKDVAWLPGNRVSALCMSKPFPYGLLIILT